MTDADAARKAALDAAHEASEKTRKDAQERLSKGKPTPTQEENDRAALGEHILEHEDDGSGPDPAMQTRNVEAKKPGASGSYQTRTAAPARPPAAPPHRAE